MSRPQRMTRRGQRREPSRRHPAPRPASPSITRPWVAVALAIALAFVAIVRIRLLNLPLERDEGEYAFGGQLILQGVPPYALAYSMKFPGIYFAYAAVLAVFGQTAAAVHWGLLLVNVAAILLVFELGRRLFGPLAGVVSAASYAVLSVSPAVLGTAAHATHFVVVPALGGVLLLLMAEEKDRPWMVFAGGVSLGLALLVKQHGAAFAVFGLLYVLSAPWRKRPTAWPGVVMRGGLYSIGVFLPLGLTCLALLRAGVFDRFWFWTFSYARAYATEVPLASAGQAFVSAFQGVAGPCLFLWLLASCGLIGIWLTRTRRREAVFLAAFVAFSALGVVPGFYFREHYFILLLPAVSILAGVAVVLTADLLAAWELPAPWRRILPLLLFGIAVGHAVAQYRQVWFEFPPYGVSRLLYGANPFPEAPVISRYISAHTSPGERIAVVGSEPEIYFHSRRRPATGYIYMYGLMEPQPDAKRMQEEMIREIETARPRYLVVVTTSTSWLRRPASESLVFDWIATYSEKYYERVGLADIQSPAETVYRWDADAGTYAPRSQSAVVVFRRRVEP